MGERHENNPDPDPATDTRVPMDDDRETTSPTKRPRVAGATLPVALPVISMDEHVESNEEHSLMKEAAGTATAAMEGTVVDLRDKPEEYRAEASVGGGSAIGGGGRGGHSEMLSIPSHLHRYGYE
uniref:Uncharacterized protein n=2 Tax=Lotharella oceanica TaxID=641309 RepID=A0A7S2TPL2_9EUKA|mmetsp:Transcript_2316/g.4414  ORF Transcript_2316/g.4414 Transcript_2316/m.4414 type:complete len:125 (+) Transcript_2316:124-498(+)